MENMNKQNDLDVTRHLYDSFPENCWLSASPNSRCGVYVWQIPHFTRLSLLCFLVAICLIGVNILEVRSRLICKMTD